MDDETLGATIFTWLIALPLLALIPAVIAKSKGRSFLSWWIYGVLLWLIALIHSILLGPERKCPHCAEAIKPEAKVCPHCQRDLPPVAPGPAGHAAVDYLG